MVLHLGLPLDLSGGDVSENWRKFKQKNTNYEIAEGDDKKIDKVLQKFVEHCEPRKNISYERFKFFSRAQESGETIDQYVTVLRKLSETC